MRLQFFLIVGLPLFVLNGWIAWWYWRHTGGSLSLRLAICAVLVLLGLSFPLLYRLPGDSPALVALLRLGAFWLGVAVYVFLMVLVLDAAGLCLRLAGTGFGLAPRTLALGVTGAALLMGAWGWAQATRPVIRQHSLPPAAFIGKNEDRREILIAAISDVHLGRIISSERLRRAIDLVAPHNPDLVLFLGDILDDHFLLDKKAMAEAVAQLQPRLGVWGIAGNHEYISGPIEESLAILEQSGIRILRDQWTVLDGSLLLAGRDDYSRGRFVGSERKSLRELLADLPEEAAGLPLIVMDHQPHHLEEAEQAGALLQLSGHTHYGQLWPFNAIVDRLYENAKGHSERGRTHYLVSVGAGTWGPPLRTSARPDVLLIRLALP